MNDDSMTKFSVILFAIAIICATIGYIIDKIIPISPQAAALNCVKLLTSDQKTKENISACSNIAKYGDTNERR